MKRINIMTSCDDNLAEYLLPQLASIHVNMPKYDIHFYLFHYRISEKKIKLISEYAKLFGNITFHEIIMQNIEKFEKLAEHGGRFPPEAYAYLYCHDLLPQDMERILYIDAGDIIIHGDISEYYFDDFEGMSFIVTPNAVAVAERDKPVRLFTADDLNDPKHIHIIRQEHVNSGCVVLNIEKLRSFGNGLWNRYFNAIQKVIDFNLEPVQGIENTHFLGDQAVLGLAFVGDMKFFGYNDVIKEAMHYWPGFNSCEYVTNMYLPYNFLQGHINCIDSCRCIPIVLHYASPVPKPWKHRYTEEDIANAKPEDDAAKVSPAHIQMHNIWREYFKLTPFAPEDSEPFALDPPAHDKNFAQINSLQLTANEHLAYCRFDDAMECIDTALSHATRDSRSFHELWQLRVRAVLENEDDLCRYEKTVAIIDEYLAIKSSSYMRIFMLHYKGWCLQQLGRYSEAIDAYTQSEALMQNYINGEGFTEEAFLFPIDPTVPMIENWFEVCANSKIYYPMSVNKIMSCRAVRTPLPNSNNCRYLAECYIKQKNYDTAFVWANRIVFSQGDDVRNYFCLINESGQIARVAELFGNIAKLRGKPGRAAAMDACFEAFNEIVLPHPQANEIIAPFFEIYNECASEYKRRKEKERE